MNSATIIPGTDVPFPGYKRKGPPRLKNDAEAKQRRGLLAKIHIAKAQLNLNEGEYEMILQGFKVSTAADLTLPQLEECAKLMQRYGFKPTQRQSSGYWACKKKWEGLGPRPGMATAGQLARIETDWAAMRSYWQPKGFATAALALKAFLKRVAHVDDMRFLTFDGAKQALTVLTKIKQKGDTTEEAGHGAER